MAVEVACEPFIERDDITCDCEAFDDTEIEDLIDQASDLIAVLSGGKVTGICTRKVRPVAETSCSPFAERPTPAPNRKQILLPGLNPTVTQVRIDGSVINPNQYVMVDGVYLTRIDGVWPGNKNPYIPDTVFDSFSITYRYGHLPKLAKMAASELVCDWVKSDVRVGFNRALPQGTRSASIAGVNIVLEQTLEEIRRRSILLPSMVRLLTAYAPDAGQPAAVFSPEIEDGWTLHEVS